MLLRAVFDLLLVELPKQIDVDQQLHSAFIKCTLSCIHQASSYISVERWRECAARDVVEWHKHVVALAQALPRLPVPALALVGLHVLRHLRVIIEMRVDKDRDVVLPFVRHRVVRHVRKLDAAHVQI